MAAGGVVFLAAPRLVVSGSVSAVGGEGGASVLTSCSNNGGGGGLGRIRLSADVAQCNLTGASFNPPLASGCMPAAASGRVYVAQFPN